MIIVIFSCIVCVTNSSCGNNMYAISSIIRTYCWSIEYKNMYHDWRLWYALPPFTIIVLWVHKCPKWVEWWFHMKYSTRSWRSIFYVHGDFISHTNIDDLVHKDKNKAWTLGGETWVTQLLDTMLCEGFGCRINL